MDSFIRVWLLNEFWEDYQETGFNGDREAYERFVDMCKKDGYEVTRFENGLHVLTEGGK